jgi:hypothetical protein
MARKNGGFGCHAGVPILVFNDRDEVSGDLGHIFLGKTYFLTLGERLKNGMINLTIRRDTEYEKSLCVMERW